MGKDVPSRARLIFSSDWFAIFCVSAAVFTDSFVYDVVVPIVPHMLEDRLSLPAKHVQRWASIMLAAFGLAMLVADFGAAIATDRVRSKKLPFSAGLVSMTAATLLFFLGKHVAVVVTARALQGVSSAIVWVSGLAYMTAHVKAENVASAMGWTTAAMAAGELVAPALGGVVYDFGGHFAVMWMVLALLAVDVVSRLFLRDKPHQYSDQPGDAEEPLLREDSHEYHTQQPVQPRSTEDDVEAPDFLPSRPQERSRFFWNLCASWYAILINGTNRFLFEATLPIYVSKRLGWSTSAAGASVAAFLCPTVFSPLVARFTARYGPRWQSVFAFTLGGVLFLVLGLLQQPKVNETAYIIVIILLGSCGTMMTNAHTVAFSVAGKITQQENGNENSSMGAMFGSLNIAWSVAMFAGPVCADILIETLGWRGLYYVFAGINLVSAPILFCFWKKWQRVEVKHIE